MSENTPRVTELYETALKKIAARSSAYTKLGMQTIACVALADAERLDVAIDERMQQAMRLLERAQAYFGPLHPIWKEIEAMRTDMLEEPWDGVIDLPEEQP